MKHQIYAPIEDDLAPTDANLLVGISVLNLSALADAQESENRKIHQAHWNLETYDKLGFYGSLVFPMIVRVQAGGSLSDESSADEIIEALLDDMSTKKYQIKKIFPPFYSQKGTNPDDLADAYVISNHSYDISRYLRQTLAEEAREGINARETFLVLIARGVEARAAAVELHAITMLSYSYTEIEVPL